MRDYWLTQEILKGIGLAYVALTVIKFPSPERDAFVANDERFHFLGAPRFE